MNVRRCDMLRTLKSLPLLVALAGCARPGPRTEPIHDGPAEAPFPYAAPEDVGLSTESLTELAALVRGWTRDTVIVGAEILVVKDGRTVLHEAAGWKDLEVGEPMRRNSIFRLLAMTKPFTGTAALMLVEDGLLELEASVSRWLPSWANERSGEVTVRQLLTHTGGWEQYGTPRPLESYESLRDMVDDAGEHGPQHPPGEAYRYSDVHSYALGALVEEVSGVPVERFIEERILEPLDLVDTHTRFVSDTAWVDRVASRYRLQDDGWEKVWSPEQPQTDPFFRASGGLFSTATDYARWLEAWMEWIGAPQDTAEAEAGASEAASPEVPRLLTMRTGRAAVTPAVGPYGFHWEIFSDDPLVFGHGGVDGTHAMAIPSLDVMVVYLTQSQGREMRGRWPRAALDAVAPGLELRRPLASVPAEKSGLDVVELTPAQRARYAGRYRSGSSTVRIFEEDGRLQRRLPTAGAPAVTLVPLGDHTFAMGRHEGGRLTDVVLPLQRLRFVVGDSRSTALELVHGDEVRAVLQRLSPAAGPKDEAAGSDTVHVAPPTGDMEDDRASILEAFGEVQPGSTVQFAPGTYLIGEIITVAVPDVTLLGHPDGTTLRGCDPGAFEDRDFAVAECNGLSLTGGHQAVRDLTFEYTWHALILGGKPCNAGDCPPEVLPVDARTGGYVVEQNTFRESPNGIRVVGQWQEPAVIRDNQFINTYHAVMVNGMTAHVVDNHISVPEPERVPDTRHPGGALGIGGWEAQGMPACDRNVIAGNRIAGHPDAIAIVQFPGGVCHDNTIEMSQVRFESPSTAIHVLRDRDAQAFGADDPVSTEWREANGSGIWVSRDSDGNMIAGNTFEDIAASAVVLEGDRNQVELQSTDDAVRDMGTGNRVTRAAGGARESDAAVGQAPQAATAQEWTDPSPHELLYVTVSPDVRLEVLDWGGDGLPLVFLAGANFNAHSFDEFAPRFTNTHRVLGITRRGHGASSWPDSGYDLPTLVEDIRVVLDSLGIDRAILAGHSMAGSEMTFFATESPDRVAGLIYIDAGHDPTDIGRLRVPELCSFSPAFLEAMERTFENPELVRRTQRHTGEDGARRPFASASAVAHIDASLPSPDYSGVQAPALGIYYVPERTEDVFMGVDEPPPACVAAFHRYIHGGIAAFTEGVEQATVIALSDTNHNIHLASPAALEAVMRQWLDSHAAPDPIDPLVRDHMEELGIPAVSLVVMRHGVVLREAAYGRPSLELDVPATPATVFPYASIAKVFTGTAVLRLVQDGRLSLDGHVADVLPGLPSAWGDVTIRQLLGHTSGLPDLNRERGFRNPFVAPWASRAAALQALAEQPVERSPGTGYSYNQTNYLLLGMLLERVDGRTVEEYVAEEIAGPLGLASLAYGDSRVPIAGRASWYTRLDFSDGEPRVVAPRPLWIEYPPFLHTAAGLNGTARDLARFVAALASGSLLDDAHRHEMWTAVPLADGTTFRFEDGVTGAGLGWWVHDDPSHPWVGMGGGASGVVRHYVNEGLTIAVLTNLQGAEPEAIVNGIADIYLRAAATRPGNGALEPK